MSAIPLATTASGYFANPRPDVAELLPSSCHHVLEIGCGEGRFSSHIAKRESYWGVEPSDSAAARARNVLDHVLVGGFEDVASQLPDRHFDLVICNDVIEHMRDHDAFLNDIQTKLAPGGVIVCSIPNVRYMPHVVKMLRRKDWQYQSSGILDRTHLRFFTEKSFIRSVEQHGFALDALVGLNDITRGPTWLGRMHWRAELALLTLATLTDQRDARYLQFGFRMRLRQPEPGGRRPAR